MISTNYTPWGPLHVQLFNVLENVVFTYIHTFDHFSKHAALQLASSRERMTEEDNNVGTTS